MTRILSITTLMFCMAICPKTFAFEWSSLWQTPDQRAATAYQNEDFDSAYKQFQNNDWKATSAYRLKNYQEAAKYWGNQKTADAYYNQGNALAQLGKTMDAIQAYQNALNIDPSHEDAAYNLKQLQKNQDPSKTEDSNHSDSASNDQNEQPESQTQPNNPTENEKSQAEKEHSETNSTNQSSAESPPKDSTLDDSNLKPKDTEQQESKQGPHEQEATESTQEENKPSNNEPEASLQEETEDLNHQETPPDDKILDSWLRRIPDDPAELLRRKFLLQSAKKERQGK